MPDEEYEQRTDSVLAWKKAQKLGRFDPNAPEIVKRKLEVIEQVRASLFKDGSIIDSDCSSRIIYLKENLI